MSCEIKGTTILYIDYIVNRYQWLLRTHPWLRLQLHLYYAFCILMLFGSTPDNTHLFVKLYWLLGDELTPLSLFEILKPHVHFQLVSAFVCAPFLLAYCRYQLARWFFISLLIAIRALLLRISRQPIKVSRYVHIPPAKYWVWNMIRLTASSSHSHVW